MYKILIKKDGKFVFATEMITIDGVNVAKEIVRDNLDDLTADYLTLIKANGSDTVFPVCMVKSEIEATLSCSHT